MSSPQARALAHVAARATGGPAPGDLRITLHFHPDRLIGETPILAAMRADGVYRSQFETGTGNGGRTAYPGGDRWRWESRIFGAAYDHAPAAHRPKYGSLNLHRRGIGGSPRFGSAHLRLTADTLRRATFSYPDSYAEPEQFGVAAQCSPLIDAAVADDADLLDDYVEAQVHGVLRVDRDVEALMLDPCYRDTEIAELAELLPCPVEWHSGFRLSVARLREYPEFRGERYVRLGESLAVDGWLDPRLIGEAARSGNHDEQDLRRVWHYVARFGADPAAWRPVSTNDGLRSRESC
ncbi:MAG TPA: DUF3626 domain-containing protein [Pseudonocardiaceae bacterium]|jgi:hypothetical protein|nr:DUF3626 domain-containing protein [Pseudonocardiaceae bacterium]